MDIETTPRIDFLKHHISVAEKRAEMFKKRLQNIEDHPEPGEDVQVVVFTSGRKPVDSAVRARVVDSGVSLWYLTGYEEPMEWAEVVDNAASVNDAFDIDVQYVVSLDNYSGAW